MTPALTARYAHSMWKLVAAALAIAAVILVAGGALMSRESRRPVQPEAGRAAIDGALDALYPTAVDHRMGLLPDAEGNPPPLTEVVAYRSPDPRPHWHYVTYGLSELEEKNSDDPEISGFGIELTLRLADDSETPPTWPINFLRWMAESVWRDGNAFGALHSMALPDGMLEKVSAGTNGVAFATDAALGEVQTANGKVTFLQVVPLVEGEYALIGRWDARSFLDELRHEAPGLLWSGPRRSVLASPRGEEILRRAEAEGSSQELDFGSGLTWDDGGIQVDALNRYVVMKYLRSRLAYGRPGRILSGEQVLHLRPGLFALELDGENAELTVPVDRAAQLAAALERAAEGEVVRFEGRPVFVVGELFPLPSAFR